MARIGRRSRRKRFRAVTRFIRSKTGGKIKLIIPGLRLRGK